MRRTRTPPRPVGLATVWRRSARRYALGLVAGVIAACAMLGLLGVAGWFITASALAGAGLVQLAVVFPSAWVRTLALSRTGFRYVERLWTHQATVETLADLRAEVFRAAATAPAREAPDPAGDDLLGRLGREVDHLDALPLRLALPGIVAVVASAAVVAFVAATAPDAVMTLVGVLLSVLAIVLVAVVAAFRSGHRRVAAQAAARRRLVDVLEGWPEIQLNNLVDAARHDLDAGLADVRQTGRAMDRSVTSAQLMIGLLSAVMVTATAWAVVGDRGPELPPIALATAVLLVVAGLGELLLPLADAAGYAGPAASATQRVGDVLRSAVPHQEGRNQAWPENGSLAATQVRLPGLPRHPRCRPDTVSFAVGPGGLVLVTGPTASGKTTLMQVLAGHTAPASGQVLIGDVALIDLAFSARASHICLVPQEPQIFTGSIADNLRLAAPDADDDEMLTALAVVDLADHVADLTDGLHAPVGLRGERLSGGQARRLTIARALLRRPDVLFLDEPTAGVDPHTAARTLARLREYLAGSVVVMALHGHATGWLPAPADVTVTLTAGAPPSANAVHTGCRALEGST